MRQFFDRAAHFFTGMVFMAFLAGVAYCQPTETGYTKETRARMDGIIAKYNEAPTNAEIMRIVPRLSMADLE